jgi:Spy/CpxP family protein refolding chaperone
MRLRAVVGVVAVLLMTLAFVARADDKPATEAKAEKKPATGRLTKPWSQVSSLSDEQKSKIRQIHAKAVADKKAIDEKERVDILALLNDEQKAEVEKLDAEAKVKPTVEKNPDDKKAEKKPDSP